MNADGTFANILTRLSFGGRPHPAIFSVFSEAACDLCNDIADLESWDPTVCRSPLQDLLGPPQRMPDDIALAQGRDLAVKITPQLQGFHEVYLDDMIQVFVDSAATLSRAPGIVPLVLHMMVCLCADDEPILRKDILADDKMAAEGAPNEQMCVLGWVLDTRRLLIRLPADKFLNWSSTVRKYANHRQQFINFCKLDSLVGKLNHASKAILLARYFLQRIRAFKEAIEHQFTSKHEGRMGTNQGVDHRQPRGSKLRSGRPPMGKLVGEITKIAERQKKKHNLLKSEFRNGKPINLIRVPSSPTIASMRRNEQEIDWIEDIIRAWGPQDIVQKSKPKMPRLPPSLMDNNNQRDED